MWLHGWPLWSLAICIMAAISIVIQPGKSLQIRQPHILDVAIGVRMRQAGGRMGGDEDDQ